MTRFGPPLPSLKPNGRKASSTDSQKPHGKHTSAAAAGIKPRRMSLGNTFVSSSDFDFDQEFKKGPKEGSSHAQKKNSRRMSLTPMHEAINNNKENKERSLRRMSLQGPCKKERDKEVAGKDSSEPVSKQSHITKKEPAKHASSFKESVQQIAEDVAEKKTREPGENVKDENIVWRDGLLQQWDSLLDASCGFKSISVAYDEHRRKSDEAITCSLDLTKADYHADVSLHGEKTAALAAPDALESQNFPEDLNVMEAVTAAIEVCSCRDDTTTVTIGHEQASSRRSESPPCCKGVKDIIHMVEYQDEELQNSGSENLKEFEADCDQPLELPASDKMGVEELPPRNAVKTAEAHSKCKHSTSAAPMKFLYTAAATAGILVAGAALLGCTYHRQVRSPL